MHRHRLDHRFGFADRRIKASKALIGKRVAARLWVDDVAAHGAECCNYLLAVDVDMNTVDGYAMSSWETGSGDMVLRPDLATLRDHAKAAPAHATMRACPTSSSPASGGPSVSPNWSGRSTWSVR